MWSIAGQESTLHLTTESSPNGFVGYGTANFGLAYFDNFGVTEPRLERWRFSQLGKRIGVIVMTLRWKYTRMIQIARNGWVWNRHVFQQKQKFLRLFHWCCMLKCLFTSAESTVTLLHIPWMSVPKSHWTRRERQKSTQPSCGVPSWLPFDSWSHFLSSHLSISSSKSCLQPNRSLNFRISSTKSPSRTTTQTESYGLAWWTCCVLCKTRVSSETTSRSLYSPATTTSFFLGREMNGPQASLLNKILGTPGNVASAMPAKG